jgi:NhaP-type Na+/H+ or K+/H+ antiporter
MHPDELDTPNASGAFPWWLLGILASSPISIAAGFVLAVILVWQRKRLQLWAWRLRGRFPD